MPIHPCRSRASLHTHSWPSQEGFSVYRCARTMPYRPAVTRSVCLRPPIPPSIITNGDRLTIQLPDNDQQHWPQRQPRYATLPSSHPQRRARLTGSRPDALLSNCAGSAHSRCHRSPPTTSRTATNLPARLEQRHREKIPGLGLSFLHRGRGSRNGASPRATVMGGWKLTTP